MEVFRLKNISDQGQTVEFSTPGTRFLVKNFAVDDSDDEFDIFAGFADGDDPYSGDTDTVGISAATRIPMGGSEVIYDTAESTAECYEHSQIFIQPKGSPAKINVEVRKLC